MSPLRRRLLWGAGIAALILLLVLTPPLVNANRYRGQIAHSMSESLGRPVHLDNVSLHLLPIPGFTLQNLVVSEDPGFGAEPTIRANTVEATLRISSLWHRPVEFSTIRFIDPSVNLVRNPEGRWNLANILLHASRVETAPTGQQKAGATPRFPYIEAAGGRVNVKYGDEKLPYALTDATFALWLPSPQQWRVRLVAHPARTDMMVAETGTIRLEGELRRAGSAAEIPVDFRGSWHDAPLGEASRILTGDDRGWRGSLNLDATLAGRLGNAKLGSELTIGGLRRAEFFPTHPLDLQLTCGAAFAIQTVSLRGLDCGMPVDAPAPLSIRSADLNLQQLQGAVATVQAAGIPMRYALLWAALFSSRVPTDLRPGGTMDFNLVRGGGQTAAVPPPSRKPARRRRGQPSPVEVAPTLWSGQVRLNLPPAATTGSGSTGEEETIPLIWQLDAPAPGTHLPTFRLQPLQVKLGPGSALLLSGNVSGTGYAMSASGNASPAALLMPARYVPQLGDGLDKVLPFPPTGLDPVRVEFTCSRSWNTAQSCTGPHMPNTPGRSNSALPSLGVTPSSRNTSPLTPRNLSPLEQAPFATPRAPVSAPPPAALRPQPQ